MGGVFNKEDTICRGFTKHTPKQEAQDQGGTLTRGKVFMRDSPGLHRPGLLLWRGPYQGLKWAGIVTKSDNLPVEDGWRFVRAAGVYSRGLQGRLRS